MPMIDVYAEAGLFDDSPHTREIIYNFMRLRALRVEVDVKLALGQFSLEEAARYLEQKVPMDAPTARQEAIAFSTGPGQALTYQIGKLQIMQLLAEARLKQGEKFILRAFHDFVWKNGNVPIALQRWEYLAAGEPFLTDVEKNGGIDEYSYSSVMDYKGYNEDAHGLGHYDFAKHWLRPDETLTHTGLVAAVILMALLASIKRYAGDAWTPAVSQRRSRPGR